MDNNINYKAIDQHVRHLFSVGRNKYVSSEHRLFNDIMRAFSDDMTDGYGTDFYYPDGNGGMPLKHFTFWRDGRLDME